MGDNRVCGIDVQNSGEGQVTKGNASHGGLDCLLVLAHSAELMSKCDGNFDTANRIIENSEDRISIREPVDESAHVSENDVTHLNQISHCGNDSLVQESNGEQHFFEPLPRKKVRLTEIKRQARSKHGLLQQQSVGGGKAIRLTKLRCLARTKGAGTWAKKLGLVSSQDDQREHITGKQCATEAICQMNCVFSEVDTIHECGDNQREDEMLTRKNQNRGTAQTHKEANSGTPITANWIVQPFSDCLPDSQGSHRLIKVKRKARLPKGLG